MSLIPGRSYFGGQGNVVYNPVVRPFYVDAWDGPLHSTHHEATVIAPHHTFSTSVVNARIDWNETPEAHVIRVDLPGFSRNDVKVEIEDDRVVCISGEKIMEREVKNEMWRRVERTNGRFSKRFQLPENAKVDKLTAHMENGVLTVKAPKKEMKKIMPDLLMLLACKKFEQYITYQFPD